MKDPIVEEIHKVREDILEECGNDKKTLMEYFRRVEEEEKKKGRKVVSLPKKTTKK